MDNIFLILIVVFIIGVLKLNQNNNLRQDQYEDLRFGSVKGYSRRTFEREKMFRNNAAIVNITIWIIRILILYLIFSWKLNEMFETVI